MRIQFIIVKCLFALVCLSLQGHGAQNELTPGEIEARRVLPSKATLYTFEELKPIFHPILHPEAQRKFDAYFKIVFRPDFPPPPLKHTAEDIFGGYRCLFNKVYMAHTLATGDEKRDLQIRAIYELMGFHKVPIANFDARLAEEIPELSICPKCVKEAKKPYQQHIKTS